MYKIRILLDKEDLQPIVKDIISKKEFEKVDFSLSKIKVRSSVTLDLKKDTENGIVFMPVIAVIDFDGNGSFKGRTDKIKGTARFEIMMDKKQKK